MKLSEKLQEELKGQFEALKSAQSNEEADYILIQIDKTKAELKRALELEAQHEELR